eukprot:SAG22_NODE_7829_length_704_cov_0.945455_1_plen_52_part_10
MAGPAVTEAAPRRHKEHSEATAAPGPDNSATAAARLRYPDLLHDTARRRQPS